MAQVMSMISTLAPLMQNMGNTDKKENVKTNTDIDKNNDDKNVTNSLDIRFKAGSNSGVENVRAGETPERQALRPARGTEAVPEALARRMRRPDDPHIADQRHSRN